MQYYKVGINPLHSRCKLSFVFWFHNAYCKVYFEFWGKIDFGVSKIFCNCCKNQFDNQFFYFNLEYFGKTVKMLHCWPLLKRICFKDTTFIVLKINVNKVYWQTRSINDFTSELHYLYLQIKGVNSQFINLPVGSFLCSLELFHFTANI